MELKIKWGIIGTASIALNDVIPAMMRSEFCEVIGLASRNCQKAKNAAKLFHIPKYFGNYQDLLDDKEIEAVYIPLPNHLHVKWAIRALRSGKHVLVEKPIALSSSEAENLMNEVEKYPKLKITEAFMYKFHPQWIKAKEMVINGEIGKLRTIQSSFSFFDDNPNSIVNKKEFGGGSLMDIGCYSISISRFLFESEPIKVYSAIEYHPKFNVDVLSSGILEFEQGSSIFFSATQLYEDQKVQISGTTGRIEFELPFNPSIDKPAKIWLVNEKIKREISFEICNQYSLQADAFSLAILENGKIPFGLKDSINNMLVIEKMVESNSLGKRISF